MDSDSKPIVDAFLGVFIFALVLGVFIGIGFSGMAGKTRADAVPFSDETDYGRFTKKHPPTTKVLNDDNET